MGLSRKLLPFFGVAAWVLLVLIALPLAGRLSSVAGDSATVELPRGSEATEVAGLDVADDTGVLVYARAGGLTPADRAKARSDQAAVQPFASAPVPAAVPSPDGVALVLRFELRPGADPAAVREIARAGAPPGLQIKFSGTAAAALDAADASSRTARTVMLVTALIVIALLLSTYRSPVLWILPLVCVAVTQVVSDAVLYLLGRYLHVTVSTGNTAVVTVLVFGVGTDYALLLLARYRDELRRTADRRVAMSAAVRGAGPAIAASAATVSVGLLCLLAADMGFNHTLGPAGAVAVLCAFAVMVTLLPALLVILGRWVFWPAVPRPGATARPARVWSHVGRVVAHRPRLVWTSTVLILAVLALGALGLRTGLDDDHRFTGTPESVAGQRLLAAHFDLGAPDPVIVVAPAAAAAQVTAAVRGVPGVLTVTSSPLPDARVRLAVTVRSQAPLAGVRSAVSGTGALVGGSAAVKSAVAAAQARDRRVVIPLVLLVVFIVLVLLVRAVVAPVLLMLSVLASSLAALGVGWFAFRHVFGFPAVDVQVLLIGFLFLVALGVDYTIFLVSRIRQEALRSGHTEGVLRGLTKTGGVITSAGIVLAATFAALMLAPYVAFVQIGFVVAAGVLIDTVVVRSVLVPALALDLGRWFWWPSAAITEQRGPAGIDAREPGAGRRRDAAPAGADGRAVAGRAPADGREPSL